MSSHSRSSSSSSSISSPASPVATNTLSITRLPKSFFHPVVLDALHTHFGTYGAINQWVPLPGFGRVLVVYEHERDAESAKIHSDPIVIEAHQHRLETTLRVYRADPSPLLSPDSVPDHLRPPAVERNFLISPPGSPPVGWEQVKEDPPNATPLADDLVAALQKLQLKSASTPGGLEILLAPDEAGGSGVGVYVEHCGGGRDIADDVRGVEWVYGETAPARDRWKVVPTALPPVAVV